MTKRVSNAPRKSAKRVGTLQMCSGIDEFDYFCIGINFERVFFLRFSPGKGMISERYFVTEDVRTKKYYQLLGDDGQALVPLENEEG